MRASDAAGEPGTSGSLNAGVLELALATDSAGKALLRDAKATGDARLKVTSAAAKGRDDEQCVVRRRVDCAFCADWECDHIAEVHGDGHTALRKMDAAGKVDTSSGDSLVADFRPAPPTVGGAASRGQSAKKEELGGQGGDEIADATVQGHVVITQVPAKKPGDTVAPAEQRATAERAVYDGASDRTLERTTLTGNVQVSDGTSVLWADRVVTEQQSGDATADGSVKASYGQAGSNQEPVHVLAARAELKRGSQIATFHGVAGRPARLWQGASQVEAPVIQFEQKQKRLLAHGEGQGAPMAVHTVLVRSDAKASDTTAVQAKPSRPAGGARERRQGRSHSSGEPGPDLLRRGAEGGVYRRS